MDGGNSETHTLTTRPTAEHPIEGRMQGQEGLEWRHRYLFVENLEMIGQWRRA